MLEPSIKIKATPTYDGVMIEETLNDMRVSLTEYKVEAVDNTILKTMTDEMLINLFHKVEHEKKRRRL